MAITGINTLHQDERLVAEELNADDVTASDDVVAGDDVVVGMISRWGMTPASRAICR